MFLNKTKNWRTYLCTQKSNIAPWTTKCSSPKCKKCRFCIQIHSVISLKTLRHSGILKYYKQICQLYIWHRYPPSRAWTHTDISPGWSLLWSNNLFSITPRESSRSSWTGLRWRQMWSPDEWTLACKRCWPRLKAADIQDQLWPALENNICRSFYCSLRVQCFLKHIITMR